MKFFRNFSQRVRGKEITLNYLNFISTMKLLRWSGPFLCMAKELLFSILPNIIFLITLVSCRRAVTMFRKCTVIRVYPRLLWMCIHPAQSHFHFKIRDNFPQIYVFSEQQQYNTTQQTSKWRRLIMLMMRLTLREKRKKANTSMSSLTEMMMRQRGGGRGRKIDKFHFEENLLKCDIFSASFTRERKSLPFSSV